jgi:hypothetical protein
MISILNSIFTVVFYAMRWTKLDHTYKYFEEILNQLNLLYKYRMNIYICMLDNLEKTFREIENLSRNILQIWMSYASTIGKNNL